MLAEIVRTVKREQQVQAENEARRLAEQEAEHQILMEELKTRLPELVGPNWWEAVSPYLVEKQRGRFFINYLFHWEELEMVDVIVRVVKTMIQASVEYGGFSCFTIRDVDDFIKVLKQAALLYPAWCERQDKLQAQQEIVEKYAFDYMQWLADTEAVRRRNDGRIQEAQKRVEPITAYELRYGVVCQKDTGEEVVEQRSAYALKNLSHVQKGIYKVIENGEVNWHRYFCPIRVSLNPEVFYWWERADFYNYISTSMGLDEVLIYVNPLQDPPVLMPELEALPVEPIKPDELDYRLVDEIRNKVYLEWEGK